MRRSVSVVDRSGSFAVEETRFVGEVVSCAHGVSEESWIRR